MKRQRRVQLGRSRTPNGGRGVSRSQVRAMIAAGKEKKMFPRQLESQSLLTSATCVVQDLSRIAEGDNQESRDGNKIQGKGLEVPYLLYNSSAAPVAVRVAVLSCIADKYSAIGDDFTDNGSSNGPFIAESLVDIVAPLALPSNRVLYDRVHMLAGLGDATAGEYAQGKVSLSFSHSRDFEIGDLGSGDQSIDHNIRMIIVARSIDGTSTGLTVKYTLGSKYFFIDK